MTVQWNIFQYGSGGGGGEVESFRVTEIVAMIEWIIWRYLFKKKKF